MLLALEEKGLPYESHMLSFSKGEHKTPEILAINHRGKVCFSLILILLFFLLIFSILVLPSYILSGTNHA